MCTSASCADSQPRPTCCAALPGDRGQVTLNVQDLVNHLSLSGIPNRLAPGRELVGKLPLEHCISVVTLPWKLRGPHYPVNSHMESVTRRSRGFVESRLQAGRHPVCALIPALPHPMPWSSSHSLWSTPVHWHSPGDHRKAEETPS